MEKETAQEPRAKKEYELAVLLTAEESAKDVLKLLHQHSIEVRQEGPLKKIALAYPIRHATQAHFGYFYVSSAPADIKFLEQNFRNQTAILRSLIVALPTQKSVMTEEQRMRKTSPRRPFVSQEARPAAPRALSNEAIEKKIEDLQ